MFDLTSRETLVTGELKVEETGSPQFSSPFPPGPAVLYLSRIS